MRVSRPPYPVSCYTVVLLYQYEESLIVSFDVRIVSIPLYDRKLHEPVKDARVSPPCLDSERAHGVLLPYLSFIFKSSGSYCCAPS